MKLKVALQTNQNYVIIHYGQKYVDTWWLQISVLIFPQTGTKKLYVVEFKFLFTGTKRAQICSSITIPLCTKQALTTAPLNIFRIQYLEL